MFHRAYVKYTISVITKADPKWKDVAQTYTRFSAERSFKKYSAMINPNEARISLSKVVIPRGRFIISTEELKSKGTDIDNIIK